MSLAEGHRTLTNLTKLTRMTIFRCMTKNLATSKTKSTRATRSPGGIVAGFATGPSGTDLGRFTLSVSPERIKRVAASLMQAGPDRQRLELMARRAEEAGQSLAITMVVDPQAVEQDDDALFEAAMARAKVRGASQAGEILRGDDMLTADAFAAMIGATRETVHKKRHRHEVLGLEGPKRGVRFPDWQVSGSGELLPGLPQLFQALGGHPWTVYRFLLQSHPELGGRRGLDALREGKMESAISAAKAIGEGSFS
jgi:hypothetical protein